AREQLVGADREDALVGVRELDQSSPDPHPAGDEARDRAQPLLHAATVGTGPESILRDRGPDLRGTKAPTRVGFVAERLGWIDCEMTGLDLMADALIHVGALLHELERHS